MFFPDYLDLSVSNHRFHPSIKKENARYGIQPMGKWNVALTYLLRMMENSCTKEASK